MHLTKQIKIIAEGLERVKEAAKKLVAVTA